MQNIETQWETVLNEREREERDFALMQAEHAEELWGRGMPQKAAALEELDTVGPRRVAVALRQDENTIGLSILQPCVRFTTTVMSWGGEAKESHQDVPIADIRSDGEVTYHGEFTSEDVKLAVNIIHEMRDAIEEERIPRLHPVNFAELCSSSLELVIHENPFKLKF